jgi:hypothetical protein
MLGRSALLAATNSEDYGNWLGNYSDVALLLRGNTIPALIPLDESPTPKTLSIIGNTTATASFFKHGNSSLYFDGIGDGIGLGTGNSAYAFGSGDFTVEAWVYRLNTSGATILVGQSDLASAGGSSYAFYVSGSSASQLYIGGGAFSVTSPNPSINQWAHVAWVRQGGNFRSFLNGQLINTNSSLGTGAVNVGSTAYQACIGQWATGANALNGFIDDLRVTKGVARYEVGTGANANQMVFAGTNDLAYPILNTAELPANITDDPSYNSVSLLLRGNGTPSNTLVPFDESPAPKTIVAVDGATISTTIFKYGTSSLYLDGTGDVFTVSPSAAFAPGTGDFTIEAWVYLTRSSAGIVFSQTVSGTNYFMFVVDGTSAYITMTPSGGGSAIVGPSGFNMLNTWRHIAAVRQSGVVRVFIDGISGTPAANGMNLSNTTFIPTIGAYTHNYGQLVYQGYIDDLRYTKGVARYTSNFTPPPAELPNF